MLDYAQALDWGLHDRMVDALGIAIVPDIYRVNSLRVHLIKLEHSVITPARLIPSMREHLQFITALRERDAQAATELLLAYVRSARDRVLSVSLEQVQAEWVAPAVLPQRRSTSSIPSAKNGKRKHLAQ